MKYKETRMFDGKLRLIFLDGRMLTFSIRAEKLMKELCDLRGINWSNFIETCYQLMEVLKTDHMFILRRHKDIALFPQAVLDTFVKLHSPRKR